MPPTPEFRYTQRLIGFVEVYSQIESHYLSNADSHVAVAAEVAVYLQGVTIHRHQVFKSAVVSRSRKNQIVVLCYIICQYRFFEQTLHDQEKALLHLFGMNCDLLFQLRQEQTGTNNRTCNKLWKKSDVKCVVKKVFFRLQIASVNIKHIAENLKSIKRNPHREKNICRLKLATGKQRKVFEKKVCILEIGQKTQCYNHIDDHHPASCYRIFLPVHEPGEQIYKNQCSYKQQNIDTTRFVIKEHTEAQQKQCPCSVVAVNGCIDRQNQNEKQPECTAVEKDRRIGFVKKNVVNNITPDHQ
ncbi:hypothetical protein SDC9_70608 [bioreactor metagenome]|uniref:Uncharacterized protein n=1 Tax=bioreactor metagenome TaxID=1076179 RepID=A0A644Y7I1_9ZZZZ